MPQQPPEPRLALQPLAARQRHATAHAARSVLHRLVHHPLAPKAQQVYPLVPAEPRGQSSAFALPSPIRSRPA